MSTRRVPNRLQVESQPWPDGYCHVKRLHIGTWGEVLAAQRVSDERPVVLKIFAASEEGLEHARHEFTALSTCRSPGIPEAIALDLRCERPCLVMEQLSGVSLKAWVESSGTPPVEQVLELAIAWSEALEAVHAVRFVHRDVTPNNLIVDPRTHETHLIDFGIASELGGFGVGGAAEAARSGWAGTLMFIPPEQTGRMNRACSFRSDLYGFGGCLYFALTGQPPFLFEDPLALIHAHIARRPVAPSALCPGVPDALSRLVLKLLAKDPEDRYASARSLRSDLVMLRDQLTSDGEIDPDFRLESIEVLDRPRFSSKLYGRARECELLWSSLRESMQKGPRVVFVEGAGGSGKTSLIDSLRPRLGEVNAYLAQGSFDPYRERPYAGWIGCFESLSQQFLVESDARLQGWRRELGLELGAVAGALVDLVPDFGSVLENVTPVPPLGTKETRARLLLAVQRLIAAVGTRSHPLILFLDDFHHSDSSSRYLLQELFSAELTGALVIVISCDPDADGAGDLLGTTRARLGELGIPCDPIRLGPLSSNDLLDMLEETLERPRNVVAPLAAQIERKSGCNPLWVRQLIDHLHDQEMIRFEPADGWKWDLPAIAGASVPDGAIGLLVSKLAHLPSELGDSLNWASCASQTFGAELLERLGGEAAAHVKSSLVELERLGLILPCPLGFRFAHERIREAARERLSPDERARLHASVATWLLDRATADCQPEEQFELADQLVRAAESLPCELRIPRVQHCLDAGRLALGSGAAIEARAYLDFARTDFAPDDWQSHRPLGFELWLSCAESAFQAGAGDAARALLDEVQPHVREELELARVEMQRIQIMALTGSPADCVHYALGVLRRWGIRWPLHPSRLRTWLTMYSLLPRLQRRARLGANAPRGEIGKRRLAALMIINAAGASMSRVDLRLTALATCYVVRKPMSARMSVREAYSISNFGVWLAVLWADLARASRVSADAYTWIKMTGDDVYRLRLEVPLRGGLHPFLMPRQRALAGLELCAVQLMEVGDLEYSYYARFLKAVLGALGGSPVSSATAQLGDLAELIQRSGHSYLEPNYSLNAYRWLSDPDLALSNLPDAIAASKEQRRTELGGTKVWEVTLWALVSCVYGRPDLAWQQSEVVIDELFEKVPYAQVTYFILYRAIAAASLAGNGKNRAARRELDLAIKRMTRWASGGPDFLHMLQFLRAERARLTRDVTRARRLYEQCAREAIAREFIHHAALAKERHASLLLEVRRATDARDALRQALQLYERWGAAPKVVQLETQIEELFELRL